jgi:hypothetical protein
MKNQARRILSRKRSRFTDQQVAFAQQPGHPIEAEVRRELRVAELLD